MTSKQEQRRKQKVENYRKDYVSRDQCLKDGAGTFKANERAARRDE